MNHNLFFNKNEIWHWNYKTGQLKFTYEMNFSSPENLEELAPGIWTDNERHIFAYSEPV